MGVLFFYGLKLRATEDKESPQVCFSFLVVPIRSLQDSS